MRFKSIHGLVIAVALLVAGCATSPERPTLAHEIVGSGPEKVIVLHDWLGDRQNYDPIRPYLNTADYTYAFADVRGYGGSIGMSGQFTSSEISGDVRHLADTLGWQQFHIVGHSMTGMAVQRVAVDAPDRVKSIVATTPVSANGMHTDKDTRAFLESAATDPKVTAGAAQALTGKRLSPAWAAFKSARAHATSTEEARLKYLDMFDLEDFSDQVKGLKMPVTVILGANDLPFFQPDYIAGTFGKWYPNLTVVRITDAGHYPMQEAPAYYAALLTAHLNKVSGN